MAAKGDNVRTNGGQTAFAERHFWCAMTAAEASIASAGAVQFLGKETALAHIRIKGAALYLC